jgi:hypothetical protein
MTEHSRIARYGRKELLAGKANFQRVLPSGMQGLILNILLPPDELSYWLPVTGYRVNYLGLYLVIILGATNSSPESSSTHLGCYRFTQDVTGSPGTFRFLGCHYFIIRDVTGSAAGKPSRG